MKHEPSAYGGETPLSGRAEWVYLLLCGIFLGSLVVTNLIANKFLTVDAGFKVFVLSAGALPYPVTFLVTDLLSEIYGHRRANQVVWVGFAVSLFALAALWLGAQFPAIPESPLDDHVYYVAFHNASRVIAASMTAYLIAQLIDVRLFHYWKDLTKGKHLWLRNNGSTILSQLVDSVLVGGAGNDLLIGGLGSDVFRWELADRGVAGTPAADTVQDFDNSVGGDQLDLRDLLQGESDDALNLTNFLHFTQSGSDAVIQVSSSGGFAGGFNAGAVDQTITLQGQWANITSSGAFGSDQQIIQDLLTKGKLITD